jgi:hypothetical protein
VHDLFLFLVDRAICSEIERQKRTETRERLEEADARRKIGRKITDNLFLGMQITFFFFGEMSSLSYFPFLSF